MFLFDDVGFIKTAQDIPAQDLWTFLPIGYLLTILIETPILLLGLARPITLKQRLWCGVWLTACTYPVVVLVLPILFYGEPRWLYLLVAETFAPVAECLLFWAAFRGRVTLSSVGWVRCFAAMIAANLASFGLGELFGRYGWFGLF
jgi:hypothetical protein